MLTKQERYNQNLDRIRNAEIYFETKYQDDTEEGKDWAIETFKKLMLEQEKLYKELRVSSLTRELQYGFDSLKITHEFDVETDMKNILERIAIICEDGYRVREMEYLKKSKRLLVSLASN
jgi:hypothetical protein